MAQGQKLAIPQIGEIISKHAPTGNAIRQIVEWINANIEPKAGNKVTKQS